MPSQFGTIYGNQQNPDDEATAAKKLQAIQALRQLQMNSMVNAGTPNSADPQAPTAVAGAYNPVSVPNQVDGQIQADAAAHPNNQNNWRQAGFQQLQKQLAQERAAHVAQDAQASVPSAQDASATAPIPADDSQDPVAAKAAIDKLTAMYRNNK